MQNSLKAGLILGITNAINENEYAIVEKLSNDYKGIIYPSYGIHP